MRCSYLAIVGLGSLGLALSACEPARVAPPNVLLVVVDTLRADRLGAYGNQRGLTPFLDALAAHGTVFLNAYSTTSWTCPSVASLMTSRYPSQHHVVNFASRLGDEELTLAEQLRPLNYAAGGFSANFRVLESLGYGQGFDHWQADLKRGADLGGAELNRQALSWLDGAWNRSSQRPALLYLQYIEPHAPYVPPEPYRSRFGNDHGGAASDAEVNDKLISMHWFQLTRPDVRRLESLYDGEVATVDDQLRQLFDELDRRGFLDNAIVIVTADHGEEFWEHGGLTHGITLYNESVHIPLIMHLPGQQAGRRVADNVSLVDVAPTLLDLLGRPPQPRFEGRSLASLAKGEALQTAGRSPDVILQLEPTGEGLDSREHVAAIVRGSTALLLRRGGHSETYDLASDPGEQGAPPEDLASATAALTAALDAAQTDLLQRASAAQSPATLDDATKEKLRALGYHF